MQRGFRDVNRDGSITKTVMNGGSSGPPFVFRLPLDNPLWPNDD